MIKMSCNIFTPLSARKKASFVMEKIAPCPHAVFSLCCGVCIQDAAWASEGRSGSVVMEEVLQHAGSQLCSQ